MESRRRYFGRLVVVLVAQLALFVSAQDCLQAAGKRGTPFRDDNGSPRLPNRTQAFITSYKFGCCGNITAWQTYVHPKGKRDYDITFQVWRPALLVQESGCYSMVGQNRYTSISLGGGGLVSETPEPSNILTVQPGDIVGYYTISRTGLRNGIQLDDSQSIDSVWYSTNTGGALTDVRFYCPLPVGSSNGRSLMSFTNAAPVLSVSVSSFTCPLTSTISPSSTSSLPPSTTTATTTTPSSESSAALTPSTTSSTATTTTPSSESSAALTPSTTSSTATTTTPSGASLSTAVIATVGAVGCSALLLILICTLILILSKVQLKRRKSLVERPSIVAEQQVNTLSMVMKGNEAYIIMTTSHSTGECYGSTSSMESNLAYERVNTGRELHQSNDYEEILSLSHCTAPKFIQ